MTLQALLSEVDPGWYAADADAAAPDARLLARAQTSALGQRLLARWLAADAASTLLAPTPDHGKGHAAITSQWSRAQLAALVRDVGVLAYAPAIRAEIRRDPVRRLKRALGNSYLLALDQTVWDGRIDATLLARMSTEFGEALAADPKHDDRLHAMFDAQGRGELHAWALIRNPALADWTALLHPRETPRAAHLPEKPMLRVYTHHELRAKAAVG
jgi:hypothetical protein